MDTFDTIVTLGHEVTAAGRPSPELEARVTRSIAMFREGRAPTLTMSGGRAPREPLPAAIAMKRFALAQGIAEDRILTEANALDTVGEAVFTRIRIAEPRGLQRLLIVTSAYHVPRAERIFRFVYGRRFALAFDGVPQPADDAPERREREARSLARFETLFAGVEAADLRAILKRLRAAHDLYRLQDASPRG